MRAPAPPCPLQPGRVASRRRVSGSLPWAAGQGAPPACLGRMLVRRLVGAIVLVLVGCPLRLHRHDEGLTLGQVGPALGHIRLCPIQYYSYGMIGKAQTQLKLGHSPWGRCSPLNLLTKHREKLQSSDHFHWQREFGGEPIMGWHLKRKRKKKKKRGGRWGREEQEEEEGPFPDPAVNTINTQIPGKGQGLELKNKTKL